MWQMIPPPDIPMHLLTTDGLIRMASVAQRVVAQSHRPGAPPMAPHVGIAWERYYVALRCEMASRGMVPYPRTPEEPSDELYDMGDMYDVYELPYE